jgi:hypothetical protein
MDATVLTRFLHREHPEPSSLEQAMIPHQAMMKDALSPHPPPPLSTDADATVTGTDIVYLADLQPQPVEWLWQHRLAGTRQDAQINYLSTLSIFMKQTTYLATLPNPNLKANECHYF